MKKDNFNNKLKELNLSQKEFSFLASIPVNTVRNWNNTDRPVPNWVESWLDNYSAKVKLEELTVLVKEAEIFDKLKTVLKNSEVFK